VFNDEPTRGTCGTVMVALLVVKRMDFIPGAAAHHSDYIPRGFIENPRDFSCATTDFVKDFSAPHPGKKKSKLAHP